MESIRSDKGPSSDIDDGRKSCSSLGVASRQLGYDAASRIVSQADASIAKTKTNAAENSRYTYDRAGHLIAESDALGAARREVFWIDDTPIAAYQ